MKKKPFIKHKHPADKSKDKEKFMKVWQANLSNLTKNDGLQVFFEFIDSTHIEFVEIAIFMMVNENKGKRYKPSFKEFKAYYYKAYNEYDREYERQAMYDWEPPDCDLCNNTGWGWAILSSNNSPVIKKHPCKCHHGFKKNDQYMEDMSIRDSLSIGRLLTMGWKSFYKTREEAINTMNASLKIKNNAN